MIPMLTDGAHIDAPPSTIIYKVPSPILFLLHHHHLPLVPPHRQYPTQRQTQVTTPSKISDLVRPVEEKRRQTKVTDTMKMGINKMGIGRPWAPQVFGFIPSAQRAMQV